MRAATRLMQQKSPYAGWRYRKAITIDHTKVAGALSGLVAALDLSSDSDTNANALADLSDLRFTDANLNPLIYETESSGGAEVYVDAGWCWYNGPRAVCHKGTYNRVFFGDVTAGGGSVACHHYDCDTHAVATTGLHSAIETPPDDHNAPGILIRPDGKITAFYSGHNTLNGRIYQKTSTAAESAAAFGSETYATMGAGTQNVSYPKPFLLSGEGTPGTGRLYMFWRNNNNPHWFTTSDDLGATWADTGKPIFTSPDTYPYVLIAGNGTNRIDLFVSSSAPNVAASNLYHFYYTAGNFYQTDGTLIVSLASLDATYGIRPADLAGTSSEIYVNTTDGAGWNYDLCYDSTTGAPVVAFVTYPSWGTPSTGWATTMHYYYGKWTGSTWSVHQITDGGIAPNSTTVGPWIAPAPQNGYGGSIGYDYAGGISILRSDTTTVYLSRSLATPIGDQQTFELERWKTSDGGTTWARNLRITPGSRQKNVRPLCPDNPGSLTTAPPEVFYMHGMYYNYRGYSTSIYAYPPWSGATVKKGARVKLPDINTSTDVIIFMYYGNPNAVQGHPADPSGNPWPTDAQCVVPLITRASSGNIAHHADVKMTGWTGLTLSAWAKSTGTDAITDYIFSNALETGNTCPMASLGITNGVPGATIVVQPDTVVGGAFSDMTGKGGNVLHHFCLVYDKTALQLYVDGVLSTTTFAATANLDSSQGPLGAPAANSYLQQASMIGWNAARVNLTAGNTVRHFSGTILSIEIYNVAQSAAWIQTQAKAQGNGLYTVGAAIARCW